MKLLARQSRHCWVRRLLVLAWQTGRQPDYGRFSGRYPVLPIRRRLCSSGPGTVSVPVPSHFGDLANMGGPRASTTRQCHSELSCIITADGATKFHVK